jgi:hypothetical protein
MKIKSPKVKVSDITNPSHHKTNVGGPISIRAKKIKVGSVGGLHNDKTRAGINRFRNLMRYLKGGKKV